MNGPRGVILPLSRRERLGDHAAHISYPPAGLALSNDWYLASPPCTDCLGPTALTKKMRSHSSAARRAAPWTSLALAAVLTGCSDATFDSNHSGGADEQLLTSLVPADPFEAKVRLGQLIFFDEHLSRPQGVSCGMCHNPSRGWGDGRPQGKGVQDHTLAGDVDGDGILDHNGFKAVEGNYFKTVLTPRNTPTIYNTHLFPNLFWDGRAGDLIHQGRFPLEADFEMNSSWVEHALPIIADTPAMMQLWRIAYGDDFVTTERAIEAMGSFEQTISVFDTPYDAYLAGDLEALSPLELQGHDLFFGKAGCAECHPAPLLTDFAFNNTGVPTAGEFALAGVTDLGRGTFTDLTQDPPVEIDTPADYAKFKTPQLRMVSVTGPYMHNGAFETLEQVVEFYDAGGGADLSGTGTKDPRLAPLGLTAQEKEALVAFLETGLLGTEIR